MDEEMRAMLEALDQDRAEMVERYRQRAIAKTTNLDADLVAWFRLNLHDGRLGNGSMAGEAVDLLWRLEHRISAAKTKDGFPARLAAAAHKASRD